MSADDRSFTKAVLVVWVSCAIPAVTAQSQDQKQRARDILDAAGVRGGLIVHLDCDDGKLTTALRAGESYIVQGLDTNPDDVEQAKRTIQTEGLYGQVTARRFDGESLPYIDNLVNLIVATGACEVPQREILRVLAPGGVACINGKLSLIHI